MKTKVATNSLLIPLLLVFFAQPAMAQTPTTDAATVTTSQTTSFSVGEGPEAVVFDGANIWVANQFSNTLSKVRVSDGVTLGTNLQRGYLNVVKSPGLAGAQKHEPRRNVREIGGC